ncbi:MAG TPA: PQQ-dependent sugar dehydrogenase [Usitatibacter sp.]|nr:PQQ-dependent sugar dehydrogenase [Usitatibacter sp.]
MRHACKVARSLHARGFVLAACSLAAFATPAADLIALRPFASGLEFPVEIVHAGDGSGRLFVVEQAGRIRVVNADGTVRPTPFLDIVPQVRSGGEQGMLGLAFHPGFAQNGLFFVYYTVPPLDPADGGNEIRLVRYKRLATDPNVADYGSAETILSIPHPQFGNHNGGKIAFGPDGYLYIGVGDGGGAGDSFNAAQNLLDLRGKLLRIDVDAGPRYGVPPSNPFANRDGARGEVYAYGLRNPWRFSFDRETDDLFIADVGQNLWEEVDFAAATTAAGRNFGWPAHEGTHCFRPASGCALAGETLPIIEYGHDSQGGFSVTGGFRYRGHDVPELQGRYVYGDYVSGRIWIATPGLHGRWAPRQVATLPAVSTFGEDENGELLVADHVAGTILRIVPAQAAVPDANPIRRSAPR